MKLTKEQVYINLQGKSKEYCQKVNDILNTNGEKTYVSKIKMYIYSNGNEKYHLSDGVWTDGDQHKAENKTEVTIEQLKEILQPMGTFTPIAMKCTQEQFEAIKPKLEKLGKIGDLLLAFKNNNLYLVNNYNGEPFYFDISYSDDYIRKIHETWNEEIFLKACGFDAESLEQQLQKAEAEVKRLQSLIEEENKPKVGDWVKSKISDTFFKFTSIDRLNDNHVKITNPELIKLLEQEIK